MHLHLKCIDKKSKERTGQKNLETTSEQITDDKKQLDKAIQHSRKDNLERKKNENKQSINNQVKYTNNRTCYLITFGKEELMKLEDMVYNNLNS